MSLLRARPVQRIKSSVPMLQPEGVIPIKCQFLVEINILVF